MKVVKALFFVMATFPFVATANMKGVLPIVVPSNSATGGKGAHFFHLDYLNYIDSSYWAYDKTHFGVDIWDYEGSPIKPPFDGEVVGYELNHGTFGNAVLLKHPHIKDAAGRELHSVFMHFVSLSNISKTIGGKVYGGETVLGGMGKTGNAGGVIHTHFELRWFDSWTHPLIGNIYYNGNATSFEWAANDWEDPEVITVPIPSTICGQASCDVGSQTFSNGDMVGWWPKADCSNATHWFGMTEINGVYEPTHSLQLGDVCICR